MRNDLGDPTTYLETFAHVSPYFDNPLLSNGFITQKLVKGKIWNIFRAIVSAKKEVDRPTRLLQFVASVHLPFSFQSLDRFL